MLIEKLDKKLDNKRCKGTKKCALSESFTFGDYKACFFDGKTIHRRQMLFDNKNYKVVIVDKLKMIKQR